MAIRDDGAARHHALYRFFDKDGALLYIGLTVDLGSRVGTHSKDKPWWIEVVNITVEHFPDRPAVEAAEVAAIKSERPRYNVAHHPDRRRPVEQAPPPIVPPAPGEDIEWIGSHKAASLLEVNVSLVYRSLRDEARRTRWWGVEGVGWRHRPMSRRPTIQVSRKRAEELAAGDSDRPDPPPE